MSHWTPTTLTGEFYLHEAHSPDTEPELMAEVRERMTLRLAHQLAEHLQKAMGGAIYSPVTFTIREHYDFMTGKSLGGWRVVGTVQALDFPDPESGEFRLVEGPMHGAIVKPGAIPPDIYPMPLVRPYELPSDPSGPTFVTYKRIPGVQAYGWQA